MFRKNLVVRHQEHGIIYCITQFGTIMQASPAAIAAGIACMIVTIVLCNAVYYAVPLIIDERLGSKHVQQTVE